MAEIGYSEGSLHETTEMDGAYLYGKGAVKESFVHSSLQLRELAAKQGVGRTSSGPWDLEGYTDYLDRIYCFCNLRSLFVG